MSAEALFTLAPASVRYVSMRQQHTSPYWTGVLFKESIRQHAGSKRQHTSAYVPRAIVKH